MTDFRFQLDTHRSGQRLGRIVRCEVVHDGERVVNTRSGVTLQSLQSGEVKVQHLTDKRDGATGSPGGVVHRDNAGLHAHRALDTLLTLHTLRALDALDTLDTLLTLEVVEGEGETLRGVGAGTGDRDGGSTDTCINGCGDRTESGSFSVLPVHTGFALHIAEVEGQESVHEGDTDLRSADIAVNGCGGREGVENLLVPFGLVVDEHRDLALLHLQSIEMGVCPCGVGDVCHRPGHRPRIGGRGDGTRDGVTLAQGRHHTTEDSVQDIARDGLNAILLDVGVDEGLKCVEICHSIVSFAT